MKGKTNTLHEEKHTFFYRISGNSS